MFPEMEQERDAADHVKQEVPLLVVLGNPPYNGFAGLPAAEEAGLVEPYRTTKKAPIAMAIRARTAMRAATRRRRRTP